MSHSFPTLRRHLRPALGCSALALATALIATPAAAQSQVSPSFQGNATTTFGSASVSSGTNTTNITVNSSSAVIDWTPFDNQGTGTIAFQPAGTTATFTGTASNFAVLNRIVPADTSRPIFFDGRVVSQYFAGQSPVQGGTVFFYSPGGIVLGQNAVFDVGNLGLTTAPPVVDANGGWYTGNTVNFGQSASGRSVNILAGAQINAPQPGSYVAVFSPAIQQYGSISSNGQVALVAGEAGTITFSPDGLFNIEVTTGTDVEASLDHRGATTGPASLGGNNRIYMVVVPKNDLVKLLITGNSSIGFDVAGAANVQGNAVVLTAGHNVTNGIADQAAAGGPGDAFIDINDGNSANGLSFTSQVTATASSASVFEIYRQTSFASNLFFQGDELALIRTGNLFAAPGSLTVMGDLTVSAQPGFNPNLSADAGNAIVTTTSVNAGGSYDIRGNLTITADAVQDQNGDGRLQGGGADLSLENATMTVGGNLIVTARADSSNLGLPIAVAGGNVSVNAQGGSSITTGLVDLDSSAIADNGGSAVAGTALVRALGGSAITTSDLALNSVGRGGGLVASGTGGAGRGGTITVDIRGSSLSTANLLADAQGLGGAVNSSGALTNSSGGAGQSGNIYFTLGGSTLTTGTLDMRSNGTGGLVSGGAGSSGLTGGTGTAGDALFIGDAGTSTLTADLVRLEARATGGDVSGATGTGGAAFGLGANSFGARFDIINGGSLAVSAPVELYSSATGGSATVGGTGGAATGGFAYLNAMNGTGIFSGPLSAEAVATGGSGTQGGAAMGGDAFLTTASTGSLTVNGAVDLDSSALGANAIDGTGGAATGGRAYTFANGGTLTINADISALVEATGGGGAVGGAATGGAGYIQSFTGGRTTIGGAVNVSSLAQGGDPLTSDSAASGVGGAATGGSAQILATGGNASMAISGRADVFASASGGSSRGDAAGNGGPAGNAAGGFVEVGGYTGTGNTLSIGGEAVLRSDANGGTGAATAGGNASGARAFLSAGDGTALTLATVTVGAFASGGDVEANGVVAGTADENGGNAIAGDARIRTYNTGGTIDISGDAFLFTAGAGGSVLDSLGNGGNVEGVLSLVAARNGSINVAGTLQLDATLQGGAGSRGGNVTFATGAEIGLYAENATLRVDGVANVSSFASGGDGGDGGAGGSAASLPLFINPNSAAAGASLIDLARLEMYSSAYGGSGGAGVGIAGGAGGDAQSGAILALGSAGNGTFLVRGEALLSTFSVGGLGGDSDTGTGGAGGEAISGRVQVGTKSGPDVGAVNAGSAQFGTLDVFSEATGGLGGQSSSGTGGAGGDAVANGGLLLVRGSPVTATSVTLSASALGGDGGTGALQGAGGSGAVADVSLVATQRFQRTDRGSANIGSLSLLAESFGGQGSVPGASYYAAGGGISLTQSDVVLGNVTFDIVGNEPAPTTLFTTLPAELRLANATLTASSVRVSTPGEFLLALDASTMTATDLLIAARTFVFPTTPPANPGTITVSNALELVSDPSGSVRTYANIISSGTANFSAGVDIILGNLDVEDDLLLTSQTGLITVGNLTAGTVGLDAQGPVTTGNVVASGSFSARSAAGAVTTGSISATAVDLFAQGPVTTGNVATPGSLVARSLGGSVTTGLLSAANVNLVAQGSVQTGAIVATGDTNISSSAGSVSLASVQTRDLVSNGATGTTIGQVDAQSIDMSDSTKVTVTGRWTSPNIYIATGDLDIGANGSIVGGSNGFVSLVATNPGGAFIGDGLSGTAGYRLSNAEFSRISGRTVQFGAIDTQANPVDLTIGALSLTGIQFPGNLGSLGFGTGSIGDRLTVSGRIRIDGAVTGTGFSSGQSLSFATGSFELNAETGSIALAGQGFGNLGGIVEIEADNIHVASPSILAKLRENPRYTGVADELNAPATVQRPDGVLSALGLLFYPADTLYIQNTGTAVDPAGFLTTLDASDIEPPGFADPTAPDVDVIINGRFATATGVVSGRDVQGAIAEGDADFAGISDTSSVNGCAFSATVCSGGIDGGSPLAVIQSEITLLSNSQLSEEPFATEDANQDEEEEAEKAASAPIAPPVILIDTRPLNPPLDIVEPVSGSGNPAALVVTPATPGENQP